jgi:Rieske 2Fe-2S family protein
MSATLKETLPSLPARWYFDPDHYQRELEAIWYRDWVCVGRAEALQRPGDYFTARIGTQNVILTRGSDGELRAWYNTCRHRGSILCRKDSGRFANGRIICPYHTWTFSIDGELLATPGRLEADDFDRANYPLLGAHVDSWKGFVFVNLAETPEQSLSDFLGEEKDYLANWPIEDMRSVHQETHTVNCNWKIFWENFSECYHCPRIHPSLCRVMPVYKKAVFDAANLPDWDPQAPGSMKREGVAPGLETWTADGKRRLPLLEGLTEAERERGVAFTSITGSMFVVGHPDYVRSVRIVPNGPEQIQLVVDWFLPSSYGDPDPELLEHITSFPRQVIVEDGEACELNQAGLRNNRFEHGVLVPQEYVLWDFHQWLRKRLGEPADASAETD